MGLHRWMGAVGCAILLASCAAATPGSGVTVASLLHTEWVGEPTPGAGQPVSISVGADARVNGFSGCNSYFGQVQQAGSAIHFGQLGMTRMLCWREDQNQLENQFIKALSSTEGAKMEKDQLVLLDAQGQALWRLRKKN